MRSLPIEIIIDIAREVFRSNSKDLHRCNLVSRSFRDVFEPLLYQSLSFTDGDVGEDDKSAVLAVRYPTLLLQSLSSCPHLGRYTQDLTLVLGVGSEDQNLPKILGLFPNLDQFQLWGRGEVAYATLSAEMKGTVAAACQQPSLRKLGLNGFAALPSSLLWVNPQLTDLSVSKVCVFTEHEPQLEMVKNFSTGDPHIPESYFANLRAIVCIYVPMVQLVRWLRTAIQSSGESGSLRTLSLTVAVPMLGDWNFLLTESPLFGNPIDLAGAPNLHFWHVKGLMVLEPCAELDRAKGVFGEFCEFVHMSLMTIEKGGGLRELKLQYLPKCDYKFLQDAAFWDAPAWGQLCDAVGHKESRHHLRLQKVSLEFGFSSIANPIAEEDRPSATLKIQQHISQMAPDIDLMVSFSPLARP